MRSSSPEASEASRSLRAVVQPVRPRKRPFPHLDQLRVVTGGVYSPISDTLVFPIKMVSTFDLNFLLSYALRPNFCTGGSLHFSSVNSVHK